MPELPEVETVRRGLVPKLVGRQIVKLVQRRRDLRVPMPAKFAQKVEGLKIRAIDRRAKYLLLRLDDGHTLIAHLGMSGRMTLHDAKSAAEHPFERHDHVVLETDEGWQVRFNDARRFGLMCIPPVDEEPALHFGLLAKMAARNGLARVSMGMSADYETAVRMGATHVRVGTALFGSRGT